MTSMKIILAAALALSSIQGRAQAAPAAPAAPISARAFLEAQYAELADLKAQIREVRKTKKHAVIGIVISTAAIGAGMFLSVVDSFGNIASAAVDVLGNKTPAVSGLTRGSIVFLGGAAGVVGSSAVVYVEAKNIDKLEKQIEVLEAKIKAQASQLQ